MAGSVAGWHLPIVYLDCIHVKVGDAGAARVKGVYLALGINPAGEEELLGIWIAQTELSSSPGSAIGNASFRSSISRRKSAR